MSLYLIEHTHTAETCPTRDATMVQQLRMHVSPENTERLGVSVLGDWVSEPEHTTVFIVESDSEEKVQSFAGPFQMMGETRIRQGMTCEQTARSCLGEA